ncbi:MAG: hypothetical protein JSR33_10045 [Proteobacteria bacterium]|nr:hypothetical protein [Pseudomonadota bacterium]
MKYIRVFSAIVSASLAFIGTGIAYANEVTQVAGMTIKNESSYPITLQASDQCGHFANQNITGTIPAHQSVPNQYPIYIDKTCLEENSGYSGYYTIINFWVGGLQIGGYRYTMDSEGAYNIWYDLYPRQSNQSGNGYNTFIIQVDINSDCDSNQMWQGQICHRTMYICDKGGYCDGIPS